MAALFKIKQPSGNANQINAALTTGGDIGEAYSYAGRALSKGDIKETDAKIDAAEDRAGTWLKQMEALKAPRCAGYNP
ncbi:hypothetical protein [Streptomyces sp. NPDC058412]|uniref:hypothetical protein n=1 Tax=Streptomyces sp. NPDC058412 TaxID=3346486 RepID=UPI00365DD650